MVGCRFVSVGLLGDTAFCRWFVFCCCGAWHFGHVAGLMAMCVSELPGSSPESVTV